MLRHREFGRCHNKNRWCSKKNVEEKKDHPDPISNTDKHQPAINHNAVLAQKLHDNLLGIEDHTNQSNEIQESSSTTTESQQKKKEKDAVVADKEDKCTSRKPSNKEKPPLFKINVGGSCLSTVSSITASPSLKRISFTSSFPEDLEGTNDIKEEAMKIIEAMEEVEERQKEKSIRVRPSRSLYYYHTLTCY